MSSFSCHGIYASTSGNVETVVETIAKTWQELGWEVALHRAEKTTLEVITQHTHFLLATSTWEHGALNPFFMTLYNEMKKADLTGKQAVFVGLGDERYEPVLFCEGIEIVKRRWVAQGGEVIGLPLRINGEPYAQLDKKVVPWAREIANQWSTQAPTPTSPSPAATGLQKILQGVLRHA